MQKRIIILLVSATIAALTFWGFMQVGRDSASVYFVDAILVVFFLGMLISNQQYEEDIISKAERTVSALLISYIVFFRFLYAPLYQFFFGTLVTGTFFLSDLLTLVLFAICFFLFGTAFLVISRFARGGLWPSWRFFNNEAMFFVLRMLFLAAIVVFVLYFRWK